MKEATKILIDAPSDLINLLQTISNALNNSQSSTLDIPTLIEKSVTYGTINSEGTDLILVNGQINVKNGMVYLEGDFRHTKFMENNDFDYFNVSL